MKFAQWLSDRREMVVLPLGIAVVAGIELATAVAYFAGRF